MAVLAFAGCQTTRPEAFQYPGYNELLLSRDGIPANVDDLPSPIFQVEPKAPDSIKRNRSFAGEAVAEFVILPNGRVGDVSILEAPNQEVAEIIRSAIKRWIYESAKIDGKRVPSIIKVTFQIRGGKDNISGF